MAYRTLAFVVLHRIAEEYFVEFEEAVQFIAVEAEEIGGFVFGVAMGDSGLARVAGLLPRGVWSSLIPLPIGGAEPVSLAGCRGIAILMHSTMLRIGILLIDFGRGRGCADAELWAAAGDAFAEGAAGDGERGL